MHNQRGFTLSELMISVFILGLIAAASVVNLNSGRQRDELDSAVRVIAADLRSLQSRALSAQNLMTCTDAGGLKKVCELGTAGCTSVCAAVPPIAVGALFRLSSTYALFGDVEPSKNDWIRTDSSEEFFIRDLAKSGGTQTFISSLNTGGGPVSNATVSFQRQNGSLGINGCYAPCASPVTLVITVTHAISGKTRTVSVNAYTGRISID